MSAKKEIIAALLRANRPDLANQLVYAIQRDPNKLDLETKDTGVKIAGNPTHFYVSIYHPIQAIGRRGKQVKIWHWQVQVSRDERIYIPSAVEDALTKSMSADQIVQKVSSTLNQYVMESKQRGDQYPTEFWYREESVKGVNPTLPEPSTVPKFDDVKGKDISVLFRKPVVKIWSKRDQKEADENRMINYLEIKWHYARKVALIAEELGAMTGLPQVTKLLNEHNIKFKENLYMDPMWA